MCRSATKVLLSVGGTLVLAAMLATAAEAATCTQWGKKSVGGSQITYCVKWSTGSMICDAIIKGLPGYTLQECTSGTNCPTVECSAYGTADVGLGGTCNDDPGTLDPNCGISGIAICYNPASHFNYQGTPFTLPGIENAIGEVTFCDKRGKCTASADLEPSYTLDICINPNWQFKTFTAEEFKGRACFCPGGYDFPASLTRKCCATSSRNLDGSCVSEFGAGTPVCIQQYCSVDLPTYDPETNFSLAYYCNENTDIICGGPLSPCP